MIACSNAPRCRFPFRGKSLGVTLDAWLKFQLPTTTDNQADLQAIGLELDRGTRDVTSFKRKLRHLLAFLKGPYQAHFHTQKRHDCLCCPV